MYFRFLFLLLVILYSGKSIGQSIGLQSGVNLVNTLQSYANLGEEAPTLWKPAFNIGVLYELPITEDFLLRPGVIFKSKGFNYDLVEIVNDPTITVTGSDKMLLNYVEIPINVVIRRNEVIQFIIGPYFARAVGGVNKTSFKIEDSIGRSRSFVDEIQVVVAKEITSSSDPDVFHVYPWEFGVQGGLGFDIKNFLISGTYSMGLTNIVPDGPEVGIDKDDYKTNNISFELSLAYFLSLQ